MATLWPSTKPTSPRPLWNPTMRSAHFAAATPCNTPITGTADCCACVANDQKVAAPVAVLKKSRRRIACPRLWSTPTVLDYIRDLPPAKWGATINLHCNNPVPRSCPLWVISCHGAVKVARPLYPRKLPRKSPTGVSALGQKRTFCAAVKNVVVPSHRRRPQAAPAAQSARAARL